MAIIIKTTGSYIYTLSYDYCRHTCMGIYGSHRAGKTHLIQQLIGDRSLRFGELYICGTDCKYNPQRAYQDVGYCPQDRGLCNAFTPRQLLTLLLMIRGIAKPLASANLRDIFRSLNLLHHMNSRICFLPNEIKRRVNIAISLVASHKVLILDEPTRGMSAEDRQLVCNILRESRNRGNSILFSSSDSVECELLADKLIVVDNGELLAIGSPHHLKRKYTKGIYLEVRLQVDGNTTEEIEEK